MRAIHKSHFDGNKSHVLKASLMFVENNKICDGCDEKKNVPQYINWVGVL